MNITQYLVEKYPNKPWDWEYLSHDRSVQYSSESMVE
jgi:hypothetical protein